MKPTRCVCAAEARKKDIPIVQLNPGGTLNYKYAGETALRNSGLPYSVIRSTGKVSPFPADAGSGTSNCHLLALIASSYTQDGLIHKHEILLTIRSLLSGSSDHLHCLKSYTTDGLMSAGPACSILL